MNDLARRVAQNRGELAPDNPRGPETARRSLADEIRKMIPDFEKAMPRGHDAVQLARDAMTVLRKTPRLAECDPMSVLGGLMTCAQLGLRPAVLGQAWLLPMRNKGRMEATLIIGYPGLIELAYRSDRVVSIEARMRHEADFYDVRFGTDSRVEHIPARGSGRGPVTDYYTVVHLVGGHRPLFSAWTREDCEEHRDKFAMARDKNTRAVIGPWRDHFDAMALKTTVIDALRTAPRSTEYRRGLAVDGGVRMDLSPRTDPVEVTDPDVVDGDVVDETVESDPGTGEE